MRPENSARSEERCSAGVSGDLELPAWHQVEERQVRKFLETVPDFPTAVQRINATGRAGWWLPDLDLLTVSMSDL